MLHKLLDEASAALKAGDLNTAEHRLKSALNVSFDNPGALYLLGMIAIRKGENGLAAALCRQALNGDPGMTDAWVNLGVANKNESREQQALEAWRAGLRAEPDSWKLAINMSTLYSDGIDPEKGVEWSLKALERIPDSEPEERQRATWMLALSLLSLGDWDKGFHAHESRKYLESWHTRDYGCPDWDGKPTDLLVIHGEQGVGDEVMFASCVADAQRLAKSVVIECKDKLMSLFARSFGVPCYPDDKALLAAGHKPTAKCAFGSLPFHFRRDGAFPARPYLKPDPAKVSAARAWLASLGPGPYVGLAWMGGSKKTRSVQRSLELKHLMGLPGTKVSVQYGAFAAEHAKAEGLPHWDVFSGNDSLDDQAALIAALDCVVTVPQTAVHVAGALGTPCHVLVPDCPSWRYAQGRMPWYGAVTLHRTASGDWGPVLSIIGDRIADHRRLQAA